MTIQQHLQVPIRHEFGLRIPIDMILSVAISPPQSLMRLTDFIVKTCAIATCFIMSAMAAADIVDWPDPKDAPVQVELLTGWRDQTHGQSRHFIGFKLSLKAGWKTYWRSPGELGIAPSIIWTELKNVTAPHMHFPEPRLIDSEKSGLPVVGYSHKVIFPVTFEISEGDALAQIAGIFEFGVCQDICIPQRVEFRADLPASLDLMIDDITAAQSSKIKRIDPVDARLPFSCQFRPFGSDELLLSAVIDTDLTEGEKLAAIPEYPDPDMSFLDLESHLADHGRVEIAARTVHRNGAVRAIDRSKLSIILVTKQGATEYRGCQGTS